MKQIFNSIRYIFKTLDLFKVAELKKNSNSKNIKKNNL